jgi:hypothetical protein
MKAIVRLFIGHACPICDLAMLKLEAELDSFEYEYIDAFAGDTQDFCDEQNIDELPHLQYIDTEEKVIEEYIGKDVLTHLRDVCDK